jgi:dTMP kinase
MSELQNTRKGLMISIEGIDCSGKSTAIDNVCSLMDNSTFLRTREPGGCPVSEDLRTFLFTRGNELSAETETLLFYAARTQHNHDVIKPAVMAGKHVVCDRYFDSTFAYQGAKGRNGIVPTLTDMLTDHGCVKKPDRTFLFDISVDTYIKRKTLRGVVHGEEVNAFEDRDINYFQTVIDLYRQLANLEPARFIVIDAEDTIEGVQEQVRGHFESLKLL